MSSSDDEWKNPPDLLARAAAFSGRGADSSMLAARRMAMQRQRETLATHTTLCSKESPSVAENEPSTSLSMSISPQPQQRQQEERQMKMTGDALDSLRCELETKKKLLLSAKSKEESLRDWWRAQKAQRLAEIAQLDAEISRHQEAMEEMKAVAEREIREAEDQQQQRLREERNKIETAIREEYEPQIAAQRAKLEELQQKEKKLQAELEVGDTAKDVVHKCVGSALATILQRVEDMFATNSMTMKDWELEVQRLIRHEVRSSFAVTTESEAQREREDYRKQFQEILDFWRKAEEEERDYVLKMDEHMLQDMQAMVHDDFERLQREEYNMEEIFVESRNLWASQHQEVLKRELEASMNRRAAELEEQRALRHQLHVERMKAVEEKHHDTLEKQRWFHEKQMALLREQHANEERLAEKRSCMVSATQADVSRATDEFNRVLLSMEGLLHRIKEYRAAVDEGRTALDVERQRELEAREKTLTTLKDLVTSQAVSVGEEHSSLSATLSKLEVVRRTVEQHLEEERLWLGKQEAKFASEKNEWEREHRRWRQMVEDEKLHVQERFGCVLAELRNAGEQLAEEERGVRATHAALISRARAATEAAVAELGKLRQREECLKERHDAMRQLVDNLQVEGERAERQWLQLQEEQRRLADAKEALREDQGRLRLTDQYMQLLKEQLRTTHANNTKEYDHRNTSLNRLHESHVSTQNTHQIHGKRQHRKRPTLTSLQHCVPVATKNTNRLPLRVLRELRAMLDKDALYKTPKVAPTGPSHSTMALLQNPKNSEKQCSIDSTTTKGDTSTQLYDSFNYNFTHLLNFSDTDTT